MNCDVKNNGSERVDVSSQTGMGRLIRIRRGGERRELNLSTRIKRERTLVSLRVNTIPPRLVR